MLLSQTDRYRHPEKILMVGFLSIKYCVILNMYHLIIEHWLNDACRNNILTLQHFNE